MSGVEKKPRGWDRGFEDPRIGGWGGPREQRSDKSAIMAVAMDIALEGLKSYRRAS